jgi:hypothetical protein
MEVTLQIEETVKDVKGTWGLMFGTVPVPTDQQLGIWILRFGSDAVKNSVARAARKYERLSGKMDPDQISKYITAVLSK